ncbi:MAG: DtxR family Mn-dependent transcriptional regulator [bacterium]|jgi:DtxR family Mn-dependent transcriptional regulator
MTWLNPIYNMITEKKSIVVEEYLLVIQSLEANKEAVKAVVLANHLKTSPSTVHATLTRMLRDGLILISKKKEISLTEEGQELAQTLGRRHQLIETFLCEKLGIPWYEVHKHAHVMEHALTPLVEERLAAYLGHPQFCPHGSPHPGASLPEDLFFLNKAENGQKIKIVMINEIVEDSEELMKFLHDKNLIPGKFHTIVEKLDITHTIRLEGEDGEVTLPLDLAEKIGVIIPD